MLISVVTKRPVVEKKSLKCKLNGANNLVEHAKATQIARYDANKLSINKQPIDDNGTHLRNIIRAEAAAAAAAARPTHCLNWRGGSTRSSPAGRQLRRPRYGGF